MIVLNIHDNLEDTSRWIGDIGKQVPFATAVALTRTAKRLIPFEQAEVRRVFDRPIPYTIKAFGTTPATKANLTATLFIKDRQAKYLLPNIEGGRRGQKAFERRLGSDAGVNAYWAPGGGVKLTGAGNLTLEQIQDIAVKLSRSDKFSGVFVGVPQNMPNAPFGIWARVTRGRGRNASRGLTPLLVRIEQPHYKKRFDFHGVAERQVRRIFDEEFRRAFEAAKRDVKPISPSVQLRAKKMVIRL
ncbi:MAG: hypothetical protein OEL20_17910 [Sulfuritalea sp.]|nr:hypothetical protein [Sulfuritalea sp.]